MKCCGLRRHGGSVPHCNDVNSLRGHVRGTNRSRDLDTHPCLQAADSIISFGTDVGCTGGHCGRATQLVHGGVSGELTASGSCVVLMGTRVTLSGARRIGGHYLTVLSGTRRVTKADPGLSVCGRGVLLLVHVGGRTRTASVLGRCVVLLSTCRNRNVRKARGR